METLNRLNLEVDGVYAIGDIHGNFTNIATFIQDNYISESCIIVCGDCGVGFTPLSDVQARVNVINDICKQTKNYVVLIRGNHDNPKYFSDNLIETSNVFFVPDYTVLNDEILLIGGGISIDRTYRKSKEKNMYYIHQMENNQADEQLTFDEYVNKYGKLYWEDEAAVYNPTALAQLKTDGLNIKHVATHVAPSFCKPTDKNGCLYWIAQDAELDNDLTNERQVMDNVYNTLIDDGHQLRTWVYGHYHDKNIEYINKVKFCMLNMSTMLSHDINYCCLI